MYLLINKQLKQQQIAKQTIVLYIVDISLIRLVYNEIRDNEWLNTTEWKE